MTKWSGPEFTSHRKCCVQPSHKSKESRVHVIQQKKPKHCASGKALPPLFSYHKLLYELAFVPSNSWSLSLQRYLSLPLCLLMTQTVQICKELWGRCEKIDNHYDLINTQRACIPSLKSHQWNRWNPPCLAWSVSAIMPTDDVDSANLQRTNAGDVNINNRCDLTNTQGARIPSLRPYSSNKWNPPLWRCLPCDYAY